MSDVDIEAWADALIARHPTVDVNGHELIAISHPTPIETPGIRPMRSQRHPVDRLRRYTPPTELLALGLVCGGWVAPIDTNVRPSAHPDARRIVQVVVMDRTGSQTARVRYPDGTVQPMGGGGVGRVPEALRAALRRSGRRRTAA
ncbi:MAG TPA: hypothetical protein VEA78_04495 [Acidimicrobiales bacterium]|nr:hypothetical protein [Acidimicrobiales bacterium]